ncbi:MAG: oligosaccharyl transferase, archaeosortase A system-associated [Acidobacteriota bacterium]
MSRAVPPGALSPRLPGRGRRDVGWLLVIVYTAILVRVYPAFSNVFGGPAVAFQGNDAWYHMRLIDHLVANFPHRLTFDPYALHPGGQAVSVAPLLDLLIAGIAWVIGFGAPSERLVETVAAWTPPVLGALTVLPVYGIGRRLLDRRAGLFAAGLLAVQPGQFLLRSILGFVDHHVMEALLSTLTVWLVLLALEGTRDGRRPAHGVAALAGLALGGYLLAWGSGSLFVAVLVLWFVLQMICDLYRDRPVAPLIWLAVPMAVTAGVVLVPFVRVLPGVGLHLAALAGLAGVPCALAGLASWARRFRRPRAAFSILAVFALAGAWWILVGFQPAVASKILVSIGRFLPSDVGRTVSEAQPLLGGAEKPLEEVWRQYRAAFALGLVGWVVLIWRVLRRGKGEEQVGDLLLPVWSLAMFAATLGQNRFGYYLDVNLCLLIGGLCSVILARPSHQPSAARSDAPASAASFGLSTPRRTSSTPASLREPNSLQLQAPAPSRDEVGEKVGLGPMGQAGGRRKHRVLRAAGALAVALAAFLPTLQPVIEIARSPRGPGYEWWAALSWMREKTPEPFGEASAYLAPATEENLPADGYGVMAWWDYGYWITRIGRRVPVANPTQAGARTAARFYLATDEATAMGILDEVGARYVIANFDLALWLDPGGGSYGLFDAMVPWSGEDRSRFYEIVWLPGPEGELSPVYAFYPAFYQTMAVRLHHFAGDAIETQHSSFIVAFEERPNPKGEQQKVLTEIHPFETYEQAMSFLAEHQDDRYRLVGRDPHYPCLPLEALDRLRQVYQFPSAEALGPQVVPQIRVLEYSPGETDWATGRLHASY